MTIAAAIPTVGRDSLFATLASLERQTRQPDQLIIVNQGDPAVEKRVRDCWRGEVTFVQQDIKGLSRARNGGLTVAETDWVYWIDDDEEANAENLEQLHKLVEAYPDVDFIGGMYLAPLNMPEGHYCDELYAFGNQVLDTNTWCSPQSAGAIHDVWGGNVAYSRKAIETVGLFDEWLGAGTEQFPRGEDTDYNARAITKGLKGLLSPRMAIYHTHGSRPRSGSETKHSIQTSSVLKWKSMHDPSVVMPVLAERFEAYAKKWLLLSFVTGGLVHKEHMQAYRLTQECMKALDDGYALVDGRLSPKAG